MMRIDKGRHDAPLFCIDIFRCGVLCPQFGIGADFFD